MLPPSASRIGGHIFWGESDSNECLVKFGRNLKQACIDTVDADLVMTKDLALSIHGKNMKREHYVNTWEYIDHVANKVTESFLQKAPKL
ncbi:uncharacterized protein JCM10292_000948 [Rhodotorula paludigena]|uniref:uncharacterized protein n=1 Tax=Rhodotorula paludigena TaxID=86838 RepID=UPI003176F3BA